MTAATEATPKPVSLLKEHGDKTLVKPLAWFHGHHVKMFDYLPKEGKIQELIKRVFIAITAPLAYLVLGFSAFLGITLGPQVNKLAAKFQSKKSDEKKEKATEEKKTEEVAKEVKETPATPATPKTPATPAEDK